MSLNSCRTWLAVAALAAAGCGGGGGSSADGLAHQSVSGSVTMDGKPIGDGAAITFVPIGFEGPAVGAPIEGGSYSIARRDGPIPGKHRVNIYMRKKSGKTYQDPDDPTQMIEETYEGVPDEFNLKSKLEADVVDGSNSFDYDLKGEVMSPPAPGKAKKGKR